MAIIASDEGGGREFVPPPSGTHQGVCVDVADMGIRVKEYIGERRQVHEIMIVWQLPTRKDDGERHTISKWYTLSLHEKANLRKDLEAIRGKAFTEEELRGFDVEVLCEKFVNALVSVVHYRKQNGKPGAKVTASMALPKGMPKLEPEPYVRHQDRPQQAASTGPAIYDDPPPDYDYAPAPEYPEEDDMPF